MNNMNPIIEKNDAKVQKENKQANEKHTMEQSVKLSISNDGMEHYRKHIQQNRQETYDDVLQRRELLKSEKIRDIDYGYEISKKAAELNKDAANAGQNALSTTDRANGYVAAYAELYDEIVQGYESGTREIYVTDENGTHKLTKDEELSNLDAAGKNLDCHLGRRLAHHPTGNGAAATEIRAGSSLLVEDGLVEGYALSLIHILHQSEVPGREPFW